MFQTALTLLSLFLIGAAHGLEPGHGKLIVTTYLAGNKAKIKDAFLLGLLVAFFHTLSVATLGAIAVFIAFAFFKESWVHSLEMVSGVIILGIGLLLFWRRVIRPAQNKEDECDCHIGHSESATAEVEKRPHSTLKEVIALGFASGLTPCPVALAALIAALSMGKALPAIGALAIFSLGIGSVLIVLGVLLIKGSDTLQARWKRFKKAPVWIARISTVFIILLGVYLILKPIYFPEPPGEHEEEAKQIQFLLPGVKL